MIEIISLILCGANTIVSLILLLLFKRKGIGSRKNLGGYLRLILD